MFLDASAVVAILLRETEATGMLEIMEAARGNLRFSPITRLESTLALVRARVQSRGKGPATAADFELAAARVDELLEVLEALEVEITPDMGRAAAMALSVYGKVVGHSAQLNMGDALSYACAKASKLPLLYKGDDFRHTDLG